MKKSAPLLSNFSVKDVLLKIAEFIQKNTRFETQKALADYYGMSEARFSRLLNCTNTSEKFNRKTTNDWIEKLKQEFHLEVGENPETKEIKIFSQTKRGATQNQLGDFGFKSGFKFAFLGCADSRPNKHTSDQNNMNWNLLLQFDQNWKNAELRWFEDDSAEKPKIFSGKIQYPTSHVMTIGLEYVQPDSNKTVQCGSLVLNRFEGANSEIHILRGTFSIFLDQILSGQVVFEKYENFSWAEGKIGHMVEPKYQIALHGQTSNLTVRTSKNEVVGDLDLDSKFIHQVKGRWRGYYFSKVEAAVCEMELVIRRNSTITFRTSQTQDRFNGYVRHVFDQRYFFSLDIKNNRFPMLSGAFDFEFLNNHPQLAKGYFSVVRFRNQAAAGRIWARWEGAETTFSNENLKKFKTEDELRRLFSGSEAGLLHFLMGNANDNYLDDAYKFLNPNLNSSVATLDSWTGVYEVFCMSYFDTDNQSLAQKIYMKIEGNGIARLKVEGDGLNPEGRFRIHPKATDMAIGTFPEPNHEQMVDFLITIRRRTDPKEGFNYQAIYGGKSPRNNRPTAGRMKITKTDKDFDKVIPKNYNLLQLNDVQHLLKNHPTLFDYFCGEEDNMVESYRLLQKNILLPRSDIGRQEIARKNLSRCYFSFRLRDDGEKILIHPLKIFEEGRFEKISSRPKTSSYYGAIQFLNENLIFQTAWKGRIPYFGLSFFRIGNMEMDGTRLFKGIGQTLTSNTSEPISFIELLVPLPRSTDFASLKTGSIPTSTEEAEFSAFLTDCQCPNQHAEKILAIFKNENQSKQLQWLI